MTMTSQAVNTIEQLRLEAEHLRLLDLKAITKAGSGHPGGTLSLAEVMSVLFFGGVLRYDPQDPSWDNRDRLVLSEGHTAPILYSAFVEAGFKGWSLEALMDLRKNPDVIAQGHTTRLLTPGVDVSTGALGMGGSKALGMALAARYKGLDYHTFAILGDGESEEGQVYEAAANASLVGADNMTWILNRNKAQQTAGTRDLSGTHYDVLFQGLGWNVVVISGESAEPAKNLDYIQKLQAALLQAKKDAHHAGKPTIIIVDTIKGKGVDFMEYHDQKPGEYKFHGVAPTEEQLAKALPIIQARIGNDDEAARQAFLKTSAVTPEARQRIDAENKKNQQERLQKQIELRNSASTPPQFPAYKPGDKAAGTREGFGNALTWLVAQHPEVVATSPDLQDSVHMFGVEKVAGRHLPKNPIGAYFPEGISESNAVGKCAGLGYEGLIPVVATFDNFLLEAADELNHAAAFGSFYIAVGTHSGCGVGPDGKSQMGVSVSGMIDHFSGPNADLFEMYEAADAQEAAEIMKLVVERSVKNLQKNRHPVYLRCTRHNLPHLDRSVFPDYIKALSQGAYTIPVKATAGKKPNLILVASGAVVHEALKAATDLAAAGIIVKVVNVVSINTIQKADGVFVREILEDGVPLITAHDAEPNALGHRVMNALNTARVAGKNPGVVLATVGVNISPLSNHVGSGTSEENYRRNDLDAAGLTRVIRKALGK